MIRNSDIDRLRGLFAKRLIATMDMLKKTVGTVADLTVFRKLRELDYCTSYSHRGRFYTLRELAEFDENGDAKPDFKVEFKRRRPIRIECKNVWV